MDPSSVNQNITVDDFDSVVTYASQSDWSTPNPQLSLPFNQSNTPWFAGTYHETTVINASFLFNFDGMHLYLSPTDQCSHHTSVILGPAIYVYGAAGPAYGSYEIFIDDTSHIASAHASSNASGYLLYSTTNLTYDNHTLKVINLGAKDGDNGGNAFLFDYLETTVQLAPAG